MLRNFLSVAKMASLVYERENCGGALIICPASNGALIRGQSLFKRKERGVFLNFNSKVKVKFRSMRKLNSNEQKPFVTICIRLLAQFSVSVQIYFILNSRTSLLVKIDFKDCLRLAL